MAIKLPNGDILRNLEEQVQKNKEDIQRHYEIERVIADWGIRIIGQLETWEIPTGSFEYGDAYAVGPDGGPFVFYIYTRGNPDYWFDYGAISIVGPQGPAGIGERGETGERGSWWYVGSNPPTGDIKQNDIWLRIANDGYTDGFVYVYQNGNWALATSIKGAPGSNGVGIASARIENNNLVLTYSNGETVNLGRVVGRNGNNGADGITSLVYIIGSLPEGSIISDTYDPSTQEPNAGVLMPVNGVQHVFIVVNGNWTDAGPYSGGSAIYSNGEYQQTFDADTKLDKVTGITDVNQVYVKSASGAQTMVNISDVRRAYAIPRYSAGGQLETANPQTAYQCANKQYVDNKIAQAHGELQHAVLEYFANDTNPITFIVDLGVLVNPNMPYLPDEFVLYGIGGYTLGQGKYYGNGPAINQLIYRASQNEVVVQQYYPGNTSGNGIDLVKFSVDSISNIAGTTKIEMILTQTSSYPTSGIMVFDCIPHSPNS